MSERERDGGAGDTPSRLESDPAVARAAVLSCLHSRRCPACHAPFSWVSGGDLRRQPRAARYRCLPPLPTLWHVRCRGCGHDWACTERGGTARLNGSASL